MQNSFGILSPEKIKKKLQVCKSKMKCAGKRTIISFILVKKHRQCFENRVQGCEKAVKFILYMPKKQNQEELF